MGQEAMDGTDFSHGSWSKASAIFNNNNWLHQVCMDPQQELQKLFKFVNLLYVRLKLTSQ
jgi:hypothetical protein